MAKGGHVIYTQSKDPFREYIDFCRTGKCDTMESFLSYDVDFIITEGWGKVLFSVCLSVHTSTGGGRGVPQPGLDGGGGGTPVRSGLGEAGTPARSGWWGVPQSGLAGGGSTGVPPLGQVWMVVMFVSLSFKP